MNKPIRYYTNLDRGESGLLDGMVDKYGQRLEEISLKEKLFLVSNIAKDLGELAPGIIRDEIYVLAIHVSGSLKSHDQEGLLEALIAQIRSM
ncbi:hypothetical protein IQ247_13810 [Plectonema cf. radiosum LEGE 06105]|uniref:Uncharacterized protein n=1 Tax=Plectonema cf. radiosum LEGE 06105 TaxID=945769 RepID=A0A8J7FCK4_9CYAN|nr:hypothetical protein [Plectonema radiosum]MBE9213728.1 hypothetical protein [Plectonema cf. radiosum LEGE 06105]